MLQGGIGHLKAELGSGFRGSSKNVGLFLEVTSFFVQIRFQRIFLGGKDCESLMISELMVFPVTLNNQATNLKFYV